jgi:lactoylglutathione lyase
MNERSLGLGTFSVSLTVKDLATSQAFYEKLGSSVFAGEAEHNFLILRDGNATIGLCQGMFERNILTFNPGWDADAQPLDDYSDVRELQAKLQARCVEIATPVEEGTTGPASVMVVDPDGGPILLDQHV